MSQVQPTLRGASFGLKSMVQDYSRTNGRTVMVITSLVCFLAWVVLGGSAPAVLLARLFVVAFFFVLTSFLAFHLHRRSYLAGQILWLLCLLTCVTIAISLFERPEAVILYSVLPIIAFITIGWRAAVFMELGIALLLLGFPRLAFLPDSPVVYGPLVLFVGGFTTLLGWVVTNSLYSVIGWLLENFRQAEQNLEIARNERLELKQVQDDLIQANRELARLSERLKVLNQVAEEARQAKTEFVANVSHELRTPLNMIIGFADVITQSPQVYRNRLSTALLSDITAIQRNAEHLSQLVNDVLDLSQVEAGRMALSKEWTEMPAIIDSAISVVQGLFDSKGLFLNRFVEDYLPPVFCDGTRIRQVIINLLSNAGRFTERGGITVRCERNERSLAVCVSDTGPGIAEEDQKRIFEAFEQLDGSIRRRYGGSGLGLSISKKFIELHDGKMSMESQIGVGTMIRFTLPLESMQSFLPAGDTFRRHFNPYDEVDLRMRTRPFKAPPPVVAPRYILLEKGRTLQHLFTSYQKDLDVIRVTDEQMAEAELSRSPAQALVINLSPFDEAPALDLTNLPYGTPAITCWVPGPEETARRLGVVDYLVKPVSRDALLEAMAALGEQVQNVLLVDDDPDVLHLFARMLASHERKYHLIRVTNGQRALSMLQQRKPDVMLLDLVMPGMDGIQVLKAKNSNPAIRDIPVIIISSRDAYGEPIVGNSLTIVRGGIMQAQDMLSCIRLLGEFFSPLKTVERGKSADSLAQE